MMSKTLYIDIAFALIIAAAAAVGVKKGFLRSLSGIIGTVAGFFAAKALTPFVSGILSKPLTPWFFKLFSKTSAQAAFAKAAKGAASGIGALKNALTSAGLPRFLSEAVADALGGMSGGMEEFVAKYADGAYVQKLAESAARSVTPIISFIVLYIVIRLLVILLCRIFSGDIPVIRTLNRAAGFVLGVASGCLIVVLLCWGVRSFAPQTGGILSVEALSQTVIGGFVLRTFW